MSGAWRKSFHYDYFRELLASAKENFTLHLLAEAPQVLAAGTAPAMFLRHDVDISLKRALPMAEIEHRMGVQATYMVMVYSPLYNLATPESQGILHDLQDMGHEVALHFSTGLMPGENGGDSAALEGQILKAKTYLEDILQAKVASISFHWPNTQFLNGPLWIFNLVNAYSRELMDWYISDSRGRWREGDPLPKLRQPSKLLLQLLIHPIWWNVTYLSAEDRLEEFYQSEVQGRSATERKIIGQVLDITLGSAFRKLTPRIWHEDKGAL